eukprot:scaffold63863_cov44-Attheya_sp.AAC.1
MITLARNGTFVLNQTLLIDGHLLTTSTAHPESFDGHHYDSREAQSVWQLIFFASAQFFGGVKLDGLVRVNSFKESLGLHWHECGRGSHRYHTWACLALIQIQHVLKGTEQRGEILT